jgi:hypothetical protein
MIARLVFLGWALSAGAGAWPASAIAAAEPATGPGFERMLQDAGFWQLEADAFLESWKHLGFRWTSATKTSARTVAKDLRLGGRRVGETLVEFAGGRPRQVQISLHNRGDDGAIEDKDKFEALVGEWKSAVSALTGAQPQDRGKDARSAVRAEGFVWTAGGVDFTLVFSATGSGREFRSEFIRLTVAPAERRSLIAQATEEKVVRPTAKADLPKNVVRKDDDVFIDGIPMVDQGQKGYCVTAATARVFNYYGVAISQHEIAQMADTSAAKGTSSFDMVEALKRIARRFKARMKTYIDRDTKGWLEWIESYNRAAKRAKGREIRVGHVIDINEIFASMDAGLLREASTRSSAVVDRFRSDVRESVDAGIPLLWCLEVGIYPEQGIERLQGTGGHMRLIIGYNRKTDEILFSDSWGRGHELKRMKAEDALAATSGLFAILPIR